MIDPTKVLLARVLAQPEAMRHLSGPEWSVVIGQGHACNLLARIGEMIRHSGTEAGIPAGAMRHVQAAEVVVKRQYQQALYEIGNITEALRPAGCPAILLKGAAYIALGIPAGDGRYLSDIDVMVPRTLIGAAESALMMAGWVSAERDPYNQRYYRDWMHEIPPMRHIQRGTVVDLHHSILPLTARLAIDPATLFEAARPIPGIPCLRVLSPVDMVLHSVTHLFHEGELERGLRDLADLDSLLRHFGNCEPGFWSALVPRAQELGLSEPLRFGLRYAKAFLDTTVPGSVVDELLVHAQTLPKQKLMDELFMRALSPSHPSCNDSWTYLARFLLYVRSHWLRMPVRLLVPHLARKFWMKSHPVEGDW